MNIRNLTTPMVVIDKGTMERNIQKMVEACRQLRVGLRPHVKSHNVPDLARRQLYAGAHGITVATLREASTMVEAGIRDVFVAREIVDWIDLAALIPLARAATLTVAIDSLEGLRRLSKVMRHRRLTMGVLLEVDVGGNRCGVTSHDEVVHLAREATRLDGIEFRGIFCHEGHVYAARDHAHMNELVDEVIVRMTAASSELAAKGYASAVVSIGSSPSVKRVHERGAVNEVRPGNYIFNDGMQIANGTAGVKDCALRVVATVISQPSRRKAVLNVGTKWLGSDRGAKLSEARGYGLVLTARPLSITRLYEEHAVIDQENDLTVGQRVILIPNHACIVANLAQAMYLIDKQQNVLAECKAIR